MTNGSPQKRNKSNENVQKTRPLILKVEEMYFSFKKKGKMCKDSANGLLAYKM